MLTIMTVSFGGEDFATKNKSRDLNRGSGWNR
jgi:hypothetical protein